MTPTIGGIKIYYYSISLPFCDPEVLRPHVWTVPSLVLHCVRICVPTYTHIPILGYIGDRYLNIM